VSEPDRPADRDQQQAAEVAPNPMTMRAVETEGFNLEASYAAADSDQQQAADTTTALRLLRHWNRWEIEAALAAARAEEAARWQAKIEALAAELDQRATDDIDEGPASGAYRVAARRLRAVLDGER
jgi:hypothetical protein